MLSSCNAGLMYGAIAFLCLACFGFPGSGSGENDVPALRSDPSTEYIVQRLVEANVRRAQELESYHGKRVYQLEYHGIFGGQAEMQVEASYIAPNTKDFHIISESGSKLLINHVLLKLLQSESDAQEGKNRKGLEISPANYDFRLENTQPEPNGKFYVLSVTPKSKSKYVYAGKIWVDAHDFAITRMEGSPAKNPSFWVSHIDITFQWTKVNGFWLPIHNHSVTQVRLGGHADLNINYSNYQVTAANARSSPKGLARTPVLPEPSSVTVDPH